MKKSQAKKIVLSQLAGYLRREVIVDGVVTEENIEIFEAAQGELIEEFERRAVGVSIPEHLNAVSRSR